jgi:hypothetical protein
MEELAALLSRERLLLELLLFKLVSLRQLLVGGEARFLPWAAEEVDRATEKVRQAELQRSLAVEKLNASTTAGDAAGAGSTASTSLTLRTLAEQAPEPWRTIFADHRTAFLGLAADLEDAMGAAQRLATTGGAAVTATLDRLSGGSGTVPAWEKPVVIGSAASYGPAATYGAGARLSPAATDPRFTRTL